MPNFLKEFPATKADETVIARKKDLSGANEMRKGGLFPV